MTKTPHTIKEFINALGGTLFAATLYKDLGAPAISNWITRGRIPLGRHMETLNIAKRRNITVRSAWFAKKKGS